MKSQPHKWKTVFCDMPGQSESICQNCGLEKRDRLVSSYVKGKYTTVTKTSWFRKGRLFTSKPGCIEVTAEPEVTSKTPAIQNRYFHYKVLLEAELHQKIAFSTDDYPVRLSFSENIGKVKNLRTEGPNLYGDLVLSREATGLYPSLQFSILEMYKNPDGAEITKGLLIAVGLTVEPNIDPSIPALL